MAPKRVQSLAVPQLHVPSMRMGFIKEHVHVCRWRSDLHYISSLRLLLLVTVCAKLLRFKTFRAFRIDSLLLLHALDHIVEGQLPLMVKFHLGMAT